MKNTKSTSRYDRRSAAQRAKVTKVTLFASATALLLLAWQGFRSRPAKTLSLWVFGSLLALGELTLQFLLPGAELHLEPVAIIAFVAELATWLWKKFETLHILQILFWIALAVFSAHNDKPPKPPMVHADAANHNGDDRKRRQRRRRRKPT